jgi:hypothetical protein
MGQLRRFLRDFATGTIPAGEVVERTIEIAGLELRDRIEVTPPDDVAVHVALRGIVAAWVSAPGVVTVRLHNRSAEPVTLSTPRVWEVLAST